ncbi:MAG: ASKHA domain-containing protein [Desulfobacterales bacterium]
MGMFPDTSATSIEVVGNAAGAGAILALFDEGAASRASELSRITKVLDLSSHPDFQETFINSLAFPD